EPARLPDADQPRPAEYRHRNRGSSESGASVRRAGRGRSEYHPSAGRGRQCDLPRYRGAHEPASHEAVRRHGGYLAIVYIPAQLGGVTGGKSPFEVEGTTVRQVIDNLERACPGIGERLIAEGR